ncbi:hypothetical protein KIH39_24355 [Telmatocola sphagniphila]|uniref:Uncharacterized protein n=1 Tax=Telmatocola sphagniphila TaxID=1123043 RepID=A0A8E6EY23_9BACT|nr:hypothetical protein [Telmatocola sphagniphila]QVL31931.1 hypothetical protein KIH39_24355 [Telmatocola sphagniphila]
MRPRKGDIVYRLSNPRTEPIGKKPYPFLSVNYERLTDGEYGGQSLIIRDSNGNEQTILIFGGMNDRAGVLEIKLGFGPRQQIPKDCEMYFTRQENRYPDGFRPTFKVSNSVTIGTPKLGLTLARPWTDKELAVLKNPPPEGPKVNANPTVGEDTALVGEKNAASFRYAEPGKKVIGVEYWTGQWANEPCLARLTPIYDTKQPTDGVSKRVLSREGYAVGGMTVRSKTFVNAVQLIFMKIKADGSLDPADNYTSEWLGVEVNGAKETKLGGTGRAVIGIHCKQGAILNSVGLVLDNGRK